MSSYQYTYAWSKFSSAIYNLAIGKDEIKARLLIIFQGDLLCITPEHLPLRLRKDYQWIMDEITKYDEKYEGYNKQFVTDDGKFDHLLPSKLEATLYRIKSTTGEKIAKKLYDIWMVLNEECHNPHTRLK